MNGDLRKSLQAMEPSGRKYDYRAILCKACNVPRKLTENRAIAVTALWSRQTRILRCNYCKQQSLTNYLMINHHYEVVKYLYWNFFFTQETQLYDEIAVLPDSKTATFPKYSVHFFPAALYTVQHMSSALSVQVKLNPKLLASSTVSLKSN
jgi:hypothetical protein